MNAIPAHSPLDGQWLGDYARPDPDSIVKTLEHLRAAQAGWATVDVAVRAQAIGQLRRIIMARLDELVTSLCQITGKVPTEALLSEIYPVLEQLRYYETEAAKVLATRKVDTATLVYPGAEAWIEQRPFGVAAIISPWNFPFQLSMIPVITALLAGNAVCIKPSELSLPVGDLMLSLFAEIEVLAPLVAVLPGDGETGRQLIAAHPDLIFFTGSSATGRKIMADASSRLIPLIMELGGKDAMIVLADAPFERAVQAAIYGAYTNSGQVCISVERALVAHDIYPAFVQAVCEQTARLRVGSGFDCELGAMTSPRQIEIVEAHYRDALEKGAQVSGRLEREGPFIHPVVLWDVTPDMRVWQEETFGPLLPIMSFDDLDTALEQANAGPLGLNGSIWTSDLAQGRALARQLDVGGCAINDVIRHAGHPGLPFGGVKQSGFGRYRGAEGLLAFSQSVSIMVNPGRTPHEPNWFPYSEDGYRNLRGWVDCLHGDGHWMQRMGRNWNALQGFREHIPWPSFKRS